MGEKEIKGTIFLTSLLRSDGAGHLPSPVELLATLPMPAVTKPYIPGTRDQMPADRGDWLWLSPMTH